MHPSGHELDLASSRKEGYSIMIFDIFSEMNNPDYSFPFNILKDTFDGDYPEHMHDSIEMSFVIDGEATHVIGKNSKKVKKGDVIIILCPINHRFLDMKNFTRYSLRFDLEKLISLSDDIKRFPGFHSLFFIEPAYLYDNNYIGGFTLSEDQYKNSLSIMDTMYDAFNLKHDGYKTIIKTHLVALMTYISHCYNPAMEAVPDKLYRISESVSYIEKNYSEKITVNELASIAHLSERQYNRIFKSIYGITPNVYLIKARLNKSCRLLENQDMTIQYISRICGFYDNTYYIKQFKRYFSITPGEYRKNQAK